MEQAETRTKEANTRTEHADLRTEKAEAQSKIFRMSELNYRRLFEAARDGILILDAATGRVTDVNPFLVELLGFSHDEMVGETVGELSPFKDAVANQAMLERLQKDGYVRYEDLPLETRDGRKITVEFVSNVYQAGDKKVIQCNIRDITARKQAEAVLQETALEEIGWQKSSTVKDLLLIFLFTLLVIVETSYFGLSKNFLHPLQGSLEVFADELLVVLSFLLFAFLWFSWRRWQESRGHSALQKRVEQVLRERRAELETRVQRRTADLARANENLRAEITERKRAEEVVRESEDKFRYVFDHSPLGKSITLPSGEVSVNRAFCEMLGYTREELASRKWQELTHPDDVAGTQQQLEPLLAGGKNDARFTKRYLHKNGSVIWAELTTAVRRDAAGQPLYLMTTVNDITERQRAEVALRKAKAYAENLITSANAMVIGLDENGTVRVFNETAEKITGYRKADVEGKNWFEVIVPQERYPNVWKEFSRLIEGGLPGEFENLILTKSGEERIISWRNSELREQNKVVGTISFGIDITERKQAEEALRENEERFRHISATTSDISYSCVTGEQGSYALDWMIGAMERITGYSIAEVMAMRCWVALVVEADVELFKKHVLGLAPGASASCELRLRHKNGEPVWVVSYAQCVPDRKQPEGSRLYGGLVDITERKQTEETVIRLAMAVEQSAETIVITNADGTIIYVNPAFEKSTGYTRAEALGQNPRILKSGKHDAEFYRQMWEALERGEVWTGHFINQRKDDTIYEEEATISPVRDVAGQIINYVAVKRDVTHEMQLESQLRQSQKMEAFGQLAGGVAHDFNNILAVIQLQAGLLKGEKGLAKEQLDYARDIELAAERGANLTRQLLLFSRKQILQPRDLKLKDLVDNMTKMLQRTLGEQIQLQFKFSEEPLVIHADPGMIDQILLNLVVNARDAMPKGGQIIIETSAVEFDEIMAAQTAQARPGSFACLSVSDTGSGIPPEILPRIFEPFFTTKEVGKGTGLGLATVFGIVQQHQGWINVYSEVGRGTIFRVYLPRQTKTSDTEFIWSSRASVPGGSETLLLVEDDFAVRKAVRKALSRLGYRVLEADTGGDALAVWKQHRDEIRLLLTDLVMPEGMNGKELAQQLLQQNPKLKVIYASGYSVEVAGKDLVLEEGVNFLNKPFQIHKLAHAVRHRLDAPAIGT
jgi:PAS domain S-box-containing protein